MEFYTALLRFINFKLYKDIGMAYPPQAQEDEFVIPSEILKNQAITMKKLDTQLNSDIE